MEKSERFRQAHPVEIVHQHRISVPRKPFSELFDPFRSLLQSYQMSFWILVSKLMIGNNRQSILQRLREDNVILIHGSKVSSGRGRIQEVSHKEETAGKRFPGVGKNQAELFRRELLQQLFQGAEADRRLVTFVKQNDSTRSN